MQDALIFIVRTLVDLYIITFGLRIVMQWIRADYRNPVTQFIVRITNPLVVPLRRFIPPAGSLDTASLTVVILLELVVTIALINLTCSGQPPLLNVLALTVLRTLYVMLRLYLFVLLIYVILSWVNQGTFNPVSSLLAAIAEPALRPLRKLIPPIGGLDLSALFALIGIQALTMLLPIARVAASVGCLSYGQFL